MFLNEELVIWSYFVCPFLDDFDVFVCGWFALYSNRSLRAESLGAPDWSLLKLHGFASSALASSSAQAWLTSQVGSSSTVAVGKQRRSQPMIRSAVFSTP